MNFSQSELLVRVDGVQELSAAEAAQLKGQVRQLLTPDIHLLEVDLSETRFIDSTGLGALVGLHALMIDRGGHLSVMNPSQSVLRVLEISRLTGLLRIVRREKTDN